MVSDNITPHWEVLRWTQIDSYGPHLHLAQLSLSGIVCCYQVFPSPPKSKTYKNPVGQLLSQAPDLLQQVDLLLTKSSSQSKSHELLYGQSHLKSFVIGDIRIKHLGKVISVSIVFEVPFWADILPANLVKKMDFVSLNFCSPLAPCLSDLIRASQPDRRSSSFQSAPISSLQNSLELVELWNWPLLAIWGNIARGTTDPGYWF